MKTKATIALFGMALPLVVGAQESVSQKQESVERALEGILSKAGLTLSGRATGEYLGSTLDGSTMVDSLRKNEPVTYSQVDFDLRARPNSVTTVRAMFRLHLDWPNFFGSPYTPFETRWLSIDGKAQDILYYSVGSMSLKWSPYTIYGNDVGFLYTPRLFAQMQEQAMGERFLGNNVRNLDGAQIGARAAIPAAGIDSFNVGFVVSRLSSAASNADQPPRFTPYTLGEFDRPLLGGRFDVTAFKGASLGATVLHSRDLKGTHWNQDTTLWISPSDPGGRILRNQAEIGNVLGGRVGVELGKFVELPLAVGLKAEFSNSSWEYGGQVLDTTEYMADRLFSELLIPDSALTRRKITGMAFAADLELGYKYESMVNGTMSVGFQKNDSGYRNDLVQSQTFTPGRILNSEQDVTGVSHYSVFDAMYHNVHRFVPETKSNEMAKNPIEKVAYSNQIGYSVAPRLDPVVQTIMPGGAATANRTGPRFALDVGMMDGAVTLVTNGWILSTVKDVPASTRRVNIDSATGATSAFSDSMVVLPVTRVAGASLDTLYYNEAVYKVDYQKIQAGLKVRAEKFLGDAWIMPIELSASYELNSAKAGSVRDFKANILNAGLYLGIWKRVALTGGYQLANTEDKILSRTVGATATPWAESKSTTKQQHVGAGLEYKVAEGSYLSFAWSQIAVEYPEDKYDHDNKAATKAVARDFTQDILNAKLTVGF